MKTSRIVCLGACVIAVAVLASAADTRVYDAPIERVWDEAVKATRDADLEVTDSDRSDHVFTMQTPKKTLSKTVDFKVTLSRTGEQTRVEVRSSEEGSKKSAKTIARYMEALDKAPRLNRLGQPGTTNPYGPNQAEFSSGCRVSSWRSHRPEGRSPPPR